MPVVLTTNSPFVPPVLTPVMLSAVLPEFLITKVSAALVVMLCSPKGTVAALASAVPAGCSMAILGPEYALWPKRVMSVVPSSASLLSTRSVALRNPVSAGLKVTAKVVWLPAGTLDSMPAVLKLNSELLPPVMLTPERVRAAVPAFLIVKVFAGLVVPGLWEAKEVTDALISGVPRGCSMLISGVGVPSPQSPVPRS